MHRSVSRQNGSSIAADQSCTAVTHGIVPGASTAGVGALEAGPYVNQDTIVPIGVPWTFTVAPTTVAGKSHTLSGEGEIPFREWVVGRRGRGGKCGKCD